MQWRKIEQTDLKPGQDPKEIEQSSKLDVNIYGDNILVLKREPSSAYKLYCCNRRKYLFIVFGSDIFLKTLLILG